MSRITAFCEWLLGRSVVWGGMACFAFYVVVVEQLPRDSSLYRWFAGDGAQLKASVSLLLFVGTASLTLKFFRLLVEFGALERFTLPVPAADGQTGDVDHLLAELDQSPRSLHGRHLLRRLRAALSFVKQAGSADSLASQLAQLAEADRRTMHSSYAGVRAIAAAIPFIGVIGALTGGTAALAAVTSGGAQAVALAASGGRLAVDIIAQSIAASILLVFAKLAVEGLERRLLDRIDETAADQLLGRFRQFGAATDPRANSVVRLCEKLLETVQSAIAQHDATINKAIGVASRRWEEAASTAAALVHRSVGEALAAGLTDHAQSLNDGVAKHTADLENLLVRHAEILSENIDHHTAALVESLEHHTAVITQTETNLAAENRRCLGELAGALGEAVVLGATRQEKLIKQSEDLLRDMQTALVEAAGTTVAQQEQLIRQGDVLLKVVEATGQVRRLEEALNSNLASLAASHHFKETVVGLSAALQLLSANLGRRSTDFGELSRAELAPQPLALRDEIDLGASEPASQAA